MGCGSSAAQADAVQSSRASVKDNRGNRRNENGFKQVDIRYAEEYNRPRQPVSKPVAFNITFDSDNSTKVDEITKNRPPPGFKLAPIDSKRKITKAEINKKIKLAEIKREEMIAQKLKPIKEDLSKQNSIHKQMSVKSNSQSSLKKIETSMKTADKQRKQMINNRVDNQKRNDEKRQKIVTDRRNMRAQEMRDFHNDEFENDRNYNYRQDDF